MTSPVPFLLTFLQGLQELAAIATLEKDLPRLPQSNYRRTSPKTPTYNCIAWAAGDDTRPWWPPRPMQPTFFFWPPGAPTTETVESFKEMYRMVGGYEPCADGSAEEGVEKIAIYALGGTPTHAALQLPTGEWTSKCGALHDIVHESPDDVGGGTYGEVVVYMRRPPASSDTASEDPSNSPK